MKDSDESQSSDPMDPLHGLSALSLFPRTFRDSTNAPKPNHPKDLESIHGFMKSMALRSPRKHSEQAKAIVDGNSELLNANFASFLAYENGNEAVASKGNEKAQERRPALGRKRARFSLKPNSSQPAVSVEPSLDIDQLQDPEEYFLAHEKLENVKKELQRQRGGSMTNLNDYDLSKSERRRRPGILGKSVSYKHHYSSVVNESDDTLMSSRETLRKDILRPPNNILQPGTADPDVELQEKELTGSISKTENRVNELLDELLSDNCENLDGDGALSFLQERLQIKPLDLDKLCLPDFHDVGKNDFMLLGENLPKPWNTLSDIRNFVKGTSGKTPVKHKQVAESPVHSLTSPTPPKSPFASIYLLKKRILQSNLLSDPFSALDLSPAKNYSSVELVDEQSDQYNTRKELGVSGKLKSLITEIGDIRVDDAGSQEMITGDSIAPFEKSVNYNSSRPGVGVIVGSSGSHGDLRDNIGSRNMDERVLDDNNNRVNTDSDVLANGPNEMEENVGDTLQQAVSCGDANFRDSSSPYTNFQMEKNVEDMPQNAETDINIADPTTGKLDGDQSQLDKSSSAAVGPHAMDGPSKTTDAILKQHIENVQEPSGVSLNERSAAKRRPRNGRKRKALSHRQSLAGAGTFWESGIRRSKRIKMRPLEYWRGERFLYGRIHESLATVIGVKYMSPAKGDGKPSIRVESYVSDKYKELVELAALH